MTRQLKGKGGGLLDTFDKNDSKSPVELIRFDEQKINIPKYLIKQLKNTKSGERRFKLISPTTKAHNLTTRNKLKSIFLKRATVDKIEIEPIDAPTAVLIFLHAISGIESWHRSKQKISAEELENNMITILVDGLYPRKLKYLSENRTGIVYAMVMLL